MSNKPLGWWIGNINRQLHRLYLKYLEEYGIGGGQIAILMGVIKHPGVSQQIICEHIGVDKSTTTKAINKLIQAGLIHKTRDPKDRRCYSLYPTHKSLAIEPDLVEVIWGMEEILLNGFTSEEKIQTLSILEKLLKNLTVELENDLTAGCGIQCLKEQIIKAEK